MKFTLQLPVQAQSTMFVEPWEPTAGAAEIVQVAQAADQSGFYAIAACEHIALPPHRAEAMGKHWADPVAVLSLCAGVTTNVRLMTYVYLLALRHPLMAAKSLATLDWLSGGRLIVGVGAGHVEEEFAALGVDYATRGTALSKAIQALRTCFADEMPTLGQPFDVSGLYVHPRPAQNPPPIFVAGSSEAAVRRAARHADGWLPQGPATSEFLALLTSERAAHGRDGVPFTIGHIAGQVYVGEPDWEVGAHVVQGSPQAVAEQLAARIPTGIDICQVLFRSRSAGELADQVRAFGETVAPLIGG